MLSVYLAAIASVHRTRVLFLLFLQALKRLPAYATRWIGQPLFLLFPGPMLLQKGFIWCLLGFQASKAQICKVATYLVICSFVFLVSTRSMFRPRLMRASAVVCFKLSSECLGFYLFIFYFFWAACCCPLLGLLLSYVPWSMNTSPVQFKKRNFDLPVYVFFFSCNTVQETGPFLSYCGHSFLLAKITGVSQHGWGYVSVSLAKFFCVQSPEDSLPITHGV